MAEVGTDKFFRGSRYEDIYRDILSNLIDQPEFVGTARGEKFIEIVGITFELTNPYDRFVWNSSRRANYEFAMKLFIWILNSSSDSEFLMGVNPNAANYIDKNAEGEPASEFNTAYGPRIMRQLPLIIEELLRDVNTRRATIMILDEEDNKILSQETKVEFPCTESISFFVRQDALHCHVNMRSNNMVTTVVYDVFMFTMLQEFVLNTLRQKGFPFLNMGSYTHHCTSAHIFELQRNFVSAILEDTEIFLYRSDQRTKGERGSC